MEDLLGKKRQMNMTLDITSELSLISCPHLPRSIHFLARSIVCRSRTSTREGRVPPNSDNNAEQSIANLPTQKEISCPTKQSGALSENYSRDYDGHGT